MITIKILGTGCPNCKKVEEIASRVADYMGLEAQIEKVTDYNDIMQYPVLSTPGLVINENLVCSGRIPADGEVSTWLADAAMQLSTDAI